MFVENSKQILINKCSHPYNDYLTFVGKWKCNVLAISLHCVKIGFEDIVVFWLEEMMF